MVVKYYLWEAILLNIPFGNIIIMKHKNSPKYKKYIKNLATNLIFFRKTKDYAKNPLKETFNLALDRASKINTTRKNVGQISNRRQIYNSRTKRFVKVNTKTGKIVGTRSKKGVPYKNIRI